MPTAFLKTERFWFGKNPKFDENDPASISYWEALKFLYGLEFEAGQSEKLQKRADRADQSVLFFLAGANFWEK